MHVRMIGLYYQISTVKKYYFYKFNITINKRIRTNLPNYYYSIHLEIFLYSSVLVYSRDPSTDVDYPLFTVICY